MPSRPGRIELLLARPGRTVLPWHGRDGSSFLGTAGTDRATIGSTGTDRASFARPGRTVLLLARPGRIVLLMRGEDHLLLRQYSRSSERR
jgi:hypothetical protein